MLTSMNTIYIVLLKIPSDRIKVIGKKAGYNDRNFNTNNINFHVI